MTRKLSLTVAAFLGTVFITNASAHGSNHKPIQFYAGLSGGLEFLRGDHSDNLVAPAAVVAESRTFASNQSFPSSANGVAVTAMSGILFKVPNSPIAIGPEIYLGQGNKTSTFRVAYFEPNAGEDRVYSSTLKRKSNYGILLRGGVEFCQDYFASLSLGFDSGSFSIERSLTKDAGIPDSNTSIVRSTKSFSGFLYGIGLEKQMGCFKVGVDLKGTRYSRKTLVDLIPTTNAVAGQTSIGYSAKPTIYSVSMRFAYIF